MIDITITVKERLGFEHSFNGKDYNIVFKYKDNRRKNLNEVISVIVTDKATGKQQEFNYLNLDSMRIDIR